MGKGSSSSETSQSTSTADNRIGADNGAIVVSSGGVYQNSFSPDVAHTVSDVVSKVIDFSGNVLTKASNIISEENAGQLQATNNALQQSNQAINNAQLGQTSLLTNPATLFAIVAAIGLVAYFAIKRR